MSHLKLSFFDIWQVETTPSVEIERYTLQQYIEITRIHYEYGANLAEMNLQLKYLFVIVTSWDHNLGIGHKICFHETTWQCGEENSWMSLENN